MFLNILSVFLTIGAFVVIVLSALFWTASVLYKALSEDDGSIHDLGDVDARPASSNRNN
jgi:hypothetical protein